MLFFCFVRACRSMIWVVLLCLALHSDGKIFLATDFLVTYLQLGIMTFSYSTLHYI